MATNMTPSGTTHFIYDRSGNLLAETDGTGPTGTVREYIYLPETEIAPTFGSRTVVDRPLAVVNAVNTASPALWYVHVDHLNRPIKMTDTTKASVWDAQWLPWGNVFAITGTANLDARFPGQWFQLESGLHYNWYRHYDPTIGRFTQADPLGFVDGPSQYAYGRSSPVLLIDPLGLSPETPQWPGPVVNDPKTGEQIYPPKPQSTQPGIGQPEPLPKPDLTRAKFCQKTFEKCVGTVMRVCKGPQMLSAGLGACWLWKVACENLKQQKLE